MTAPQLSSIEHAKVISAGIHDDDVIADMVKHLDAFVPCHDCDRPATVRVRARCCPSTDLLCDLHHAELRVLLMERLAQAWKDRNRCVHCASCGHIFPRHSTLGDLIEESGL